MLVSPQVKVSEYNQMKAAVSSLARKGQGNLAVRDLSAELNADQMVQSENLTTLLVVVPKYNAKDWLSSYERMTQYVVPRSSKCLLDDSDQCLYSVVLFKRVADAFKTAAQDAGFQVCKTLLGPTRCRGAGPGRPASQCRIPAASRAPTGVSRPKGHEERRHILSIFLRRLEFAA